MAALVRGAEGRQSINSGTMAGISVLFERQGGHARLEHLTPEADIRVLESVNCL